MKTELHRYVAKDLKTFTPEVLPLLGIHKLIFLDAHIKAIYNYIPLKLGIAIAYPDLGFFFYYYYKSFNLK